MYYFIVNPAACDGAGAKIWKRLERKLKNSGAEYKAMLTQEAGDAGRFARELTQNCREPRILVAVGGDGTMNEIINGLSFECQVTLGYIPTGTGNDLARSIGLPKSPRRCLKRILNPKYYKLLDYGCLSYESGAPLYRRFMVSGGIGLDASVCHSLLDAHRKYRPRLPFVRRMAYIAVGLYQLAKARPVKGYLLLDDTKKVEYNHIYFISVHIHPYEGGGFWFAPKADGSDGMLEVCVAHHSSKWKLLTTLAGTRFRRSKSLRGVRTYSCREVKIHVDRPMAVHTDGESCFCQTDISLSCVEKKVRMIV